MRQHRVLAKIALDEMHAVDWLHLQQVERQDQAAAANPLRRHLTDRLHSRPVDEPDAPPNEIGQWPKRLTLPTAADSIAV